MFADCVARQKSSEVLKNIGFIASVEGGFNEYERKRLALQLKDHEDVIGGYFIDGIHRNGSEAANINTSSLKSIVTHTISLLPAEKLKVMLGAYKPHVALELISFGIDLLDTSYANIVTASNRALVFDFSLADSKNVFPELDIMDVKLKDDFSPLVAGCPCLACKKHSRAYIHHLLNTHELLGPMLLSIHNIHHYKLFFESIRSSIANDRLSELLKQVRDQYDQKVFSYTVDEIAKDVTEENKVESA